MALSEGSGAGAETGRGRVIRDFPAYARTIASHIARGQRPVCVGVLLSSRWGYFNHVAKICIKPDEWAPGRFEFGYLRGMHVVVVPGDDCEDLQLAQLLVDLMRIGPALLWVFGADGTKISDDEQAFLLPDYAAQLARGKVDDLGAFYRNAKVASAVMAAVQRKDAQRFLTEFERIREKSGDDAALEFHLREERAKLQVREWFSRPYLDRGESAAA